MRVGGDGSRDGARRSAGVGRPSGSPTEDEESHLAPNEGDSLFVGMGAICDTAERLTGADGAAVAVLASSGEVRELVHATDALAQQIDELQFTLGEGPCLDAYRRNEAQLCAELDDREYAQRWPLFTAESAALGAAAIFAFPVPGELHPMGVLELHRRTVGPLTARELESAQMCATAIRVALEANWHAQVVRSGSVAAAVEAATLHGIAAPAPEDSFTRSQVHVAAGMVAVQLKVPGQDGLARLRAYAYTNRRSVVAVAAEVVSRRLSLQDPDDDDDGEESR
jgi:hypothetical protein